MLRTVYLSVRGYVVDTDRGPFKVPNASSEL